MFAVQISERKEGRDPGSAAESQVWRTQALCLRMRLCVYMGVSRYRLNPGPYSY